IGGNGAYSASAGEDAPSSQSLPRSAMLPADAGARPTGDLGWNANGAMGLLGRIPSAYGPQSGKLPSRRPSASSLPLSVCDLPSPPHVSGARACLKPYPMGACSQSVLGVLCRIALPFCALVRTGWAASDTTSCLIPVIGRSSL